MISDVGNKALNKLLKVLAILKAACPHDKLLTDHMADQIKAAIELLEEK